MKNPLLVIGGALAAIIGLGYIVSGRKLQNLQFKLVNGVRYVAQSGLIENLTNQKIAINAQIYNPNKTKSLLTSFDGIAFLDGMKISAIKVAGNFELAPKANTILKNITLTIPTANLLKEIYNIISNINDVSKFTSQAKNYLNGKVLKVTGEMKADGYTYNVDESIIIKM
jgi:hypothetical protein